MSKEKYSIGQVAKMLNVTPRTLRFYEQKKLIQPQRIDDNGYRIYEQTDIEKLQIISYLRTLGFSIKKIGELLGKENSSESLKLLITQEIVENKTEIEKLQKKQEKLFQLKKILNRRKLDKDNLSDITNIMRNSTTLNQLRKRITYYGFGILALEVVGMIGIAGILFSHHIILGEILAGLLALILIIFSTILSKKYYDCVAYVCPSCGTKFIPTFKQFLFSPHTPRFRKLRCPKCGKKSYCLEVLR